MKRPSLSSLLSLIVFHAVATCSVDAAPSTEELFSTAPKAITGLYTGYDSRDRPVPDPNFVYTPWRLLEITEVGGRAKISYESSFDPGRRDYFENKFLLTEGFIVLTETGGHRPTPLFVDSTKPVDIEGGLWTFGYSGGQSGNVSVASWTWTQDPPSIPAPQPVVMVPRGVEAGLELNYAVARSLRRKDSKTASSLLLRQRKLLRQALSSAN
jgi:hypothetical protein